MDTVADLIQLARRGYEVRLTPELADDGGLAAVHLRLTQTKVGAERGQEYALNFLEAPHMAASMGMSLHRAGITLPHG